MALQYVITYVVWTLLLFSQAFYGYIVLGFFAGVSWGGINVVVEFARRQG